jgi:hypothetical protein
MMGKRSPQARVFAADRLWLDYVGRDALYGYLAEHREELFRDEDFAAWPISAHTYPYGGCQATGMPTATG